MVNIQKPPQGIDPQTYNYLYQLAELLGVYLGNVENTSATPAVVESKPAESAVAEQVGVSTEEQYAALKSLIIKTADQVTVQRTSPQINSLNGAVIDTLNKINDLGNKMSEEYVAISDYGTYLEQINMELQANPDAITQYYSFYSDLNANIDKVSAAFENYKVGTEGYIRTGIVYYDGAVPVYGVAVGQNLTATEVDGEVVVDQTNFRATYTAKKLSFWQDEDEVAYVSNNRLYITNITVLNGMNIGQWEVTTAGGLKFKWTGG